MANIVLPTVSILNEATENTTILIEENGEIYRLILLNIINTIVDNKIASITNAENVEF